MVHEAPPWFGRLTARMDSDRAQHITLKREPQSTVPPGVPISNCKHLPVLRRLRIQSAHTRERIRQLAGGSWWVEGRRHTIATEHLATSHRKFSTVRGELPPMEDRCAYGPFPL